MKLHEKDDNRPTYSEFCTSADSGLNKVALTLIQSLHNNVITIN